MTTTLARPTYVHRSVEAPAMEVDTRKGVVRAIISDDSCDRYDTVFLPDGCDWSAFKAAGGPVLWAHGDSREREGIPVGNAERLVTTTYGGRRSIVADVRFWSTDDFSRQLKEAYESQKIIYTEDFQDGRDVEGVRFVNPFAADSALIP